jgi:hypothetical protein
MLHVELLIIIPTLALSVHITRPDTINACVTDIPTGTIQTTVQGTHHTLVLNDVVFRTRCTDPVKHHLPISTDTLTINVLGSRVYTLLTEERVE